MYSRREVMTGLGATAVAATVPVTVSADHRDPYEAQPEYVDLTYPTSELDTYRPYIVSRHLNIQPSALYAWKATSTERDTDMYCYWAYYVTQEGVSSQDSHQYDREPVYVEVDQQGNVAAVHADGYHYLAVTWGQFDQSGDNVLLRSVRPWHFYNRTTEVGDDNIQLESLHHRYQAWLNNDWSVHPRTVVNPWTIKTRGHWWANDVGTVSARASYWRALSNVGSSTGLNIRGTEESEL